MKSEIDTIISQNLKYTIEVQSDTTIVKSELKGISIELAILFGLVFIINIFQFK